MRAPTSNAISQGKHGAYNAVDYRAVPDPVIYAPEDGVITFRGNDGDCGEKLWLQSGTRRHTFCHLQAYWVVLNQKVIKGQRLGLMGNTGRSTGPHLHWAVNIGGNTWVYPPSLVDEPFNKEETMNNEAGAEMYRTVLHREPENPAVTGQWNGQSPAQALRAVRGAEWQSIAARLKNYANLEKQVAELSARPTKAELEAVVAQFNAANAKVKELEAKTSEDSKLLDDTGSIIQRIINRLLRKG